MDPMFVKDRLALMLDHFSVVGDPREGCKVRYPLREMLFLVTCATISGCDDYDEIADWGPSQGVAHLGFLQGYSEYYFGTPKEDWLRVVLNRIAPALFEACFTDWALTLRPDAADLIALDGKSLRRSGGAGHKPLHLVSAWASTWATGAGARGGRQQGERVCGHAGDPGAAPDQGCAGHHRRHRHQSGHGRGHPRAGW